mmetsp:Transcript_17753/g.57404  ORF Transcript_17753/g.57404 Transcript_17753/m.57404 type:complete len:139 (+) Transcript_17753:1744-2160(+)
MIVCVAVVGQQNNPLYLESFAGDNGEDALRFHYIVHCALDVIEEKVAAPSKGAASLNETYLGLLYPTEDFNVYGYMSNTRVKFVMVLDDAEVKDADVRMVFRRFHSAYVDAVCNPFHTPGQRLVSKNFDARIRAALQI